MPDGNAKLEALQKRKDALNTRIARLQAAAKETERKQEERLIVLTGSAILADLKQNPETAKLVGVILDRAVTAPRDRELLIACKLIGSCSSSSASASGKSDNPARGAAAL